MKITTRLTGSFAWLVELLTTVTIKKMIAETRATEMLWLEFKVVLEQDMRAGLATA